MEGRALWLFKFFRLFIYCGSRTYVAFLPYITLSFRSNESRIAGGLIFGWFNYVIVIGWFRKKGVIGVETETRIHCTKYFGYVYTVGSFCTPTISYCFDTNTVGLDVFRGCLTFGNHTKLVEQHKR